MPRTICDNCSRQFDTSRPACPHCGLALHAPIRTFAPSIIVGGPDLQTGEHTLRVDDPSGIRSEARRLSDGLISLSVARAAGIGRPGEARAAHTLRDRLVSEGHDVKILPGEDRDGIDRTVEIDGDTFVLQITVVPREPFWHEAHVSSATTQVMLSEAVDWVRKAILSKAYAPKTQKTPVVLAVDARPAGVVATPEFVQQYLALYGSPVDEFGFASVWLVGPTADYCCRVGDARP